MQNEQTYDTPWLLNRINQGETPEYLLFWGHRAKPSTVTKACFSQWWPSKFVVDEDVFETAEHWMMAHKAKLFGAHEIYSQILNNPDPRAAKGLGRKIENFDAKIWNANKFSIVVEGNLHKFQQNDALLTFLLATERKVLVEASPVDTIWGIGLARDHEDALSPEKWRGPNLLGYALMTVRDLLKV
ncbi:MAG: NADAR family protein [Hyphomonadaceae bacterium]